MSQSQPPHDRIHVHDDVRAFDVIGDIHGCYDELVELLVRLGHRDLLDPEIPPAAPGEKPRVVFVGDIVDRGDKIIEALALVHRLWSRGHALSVIGNHDERFQRWLAGRTVYVRHGLEQTIDQYRQLSIERRREWRLELLEFFAHLPWAIRLDSGRVLIAHAAWHADLHLEPSPERVKRYAMYGPTTGRKTPEGFPERIDWAPHYKGPDRVIFGHQVYPEPYFNAFAVGIDTGCVFGGSLTGYRYPDGGVVSVRRGGSRA